MKLYTDHVLTSTSVDTTSVASTWNTLQIIAHQLTCTRESSWAPDNVADKASHIVTRTDAVTMVSGRNEGRQCDAVKCSGVAASANQEHA